MNVITAKARLDKQQGVMFDGTSMPHVNAEIK
jgi:hypothetical protein